jgi:CHAT domain-containing protein/Tfp pilus assembly protein PilF
MIGRGSGDCISRVGVSVIALLFIVEPAKPVLAQVLSTDQRSAMAEGNRLQRQAHELHAAGNLRKAIAVIETKVSNDEHAFGVDSFPVAETLGILSQLQMELEDFESARASTKRAYECWRKQLGERHWRVVNARLALEKCTQVSKLDRTQLQKLADADRDRLQVIPLVETGKAAGAIAVANRAKDSYELLLGKNCSSYAESLDFLARAIEAKGDYATGRELLEEALVIRKAVFGPDHPIYAAGLNSLGQALQELGEYDSARQLFEHALLIIKTALGERNNAYSTFLHNLGFVLSAQGDYATAREHFEKSLTIVRSMTGEESPSYANGLDSMAHLLREMHDYAGARPLCEKVLAIRRKLPGGERRPDYAAAMGELAYVLRQQGEIAAAQSLYEQYIELRRKTVGEHHPAFIGSLSNIAGFLLELGEVDRAQPICKQVVRLSAEAWGKHHPEYARAISLLGAVRRARNDYAGAQSLAEENLAITRSTRGDRHPYCRDAFANLAVLRWEQSDYPGAVALYVQALEIAEFNLDLSAIAQSERQQLAMARGFRSALDDYLSVASLANVAPDKIYAHILFLKGAIFARQKHLSLMRRFAQERPGSVTSTLFATWQRATTELATLANSGPAPQHEEEWKRRLGGLSNMRDDAESALSRSDDAFRTTRDEARRSPEAIQAALPNDAILIDFVEYKHVSVSARKWAPAESRVIAFVVRSGRPIRALDLGPQATIATAIEGWRAELFRRGDGSDKDAQESRRLIWTPLEPYLDGIKTVLVCPDGAIGLAPIAALPGKKDGTYLVEEFTISVIPAARMLKNDQHPLVQDGTVPTLLLVGDVDYDAPSGPVGGHGSSRSATRSNERGNRMKFDRLPATSAEIASVRRDFYAALPMGRVRTLNAGDSTEFSLRQEASNCRFLHLATHGFFDPKNRSFNFSSQTPGRRVQEIDPFGGQDLVDFHPGLLSGIALAGANQERPPIGQDDGILTALEVAVLDLSRCELAVLSACETGLGKAAGGEGLLGLQRAFQTAGARSVVATLWNVDDEPTEVLMAAFYANLWRKGQPPAEAIREAQLSMLRGEANFGGRARSGLKRTNDTAKSHRLSPFYWAAFVLSTDRP